jgi:hypothetical protein
VIPKGSPYRGIFYIMVNMIYKAIVPPGLITLQWFLKNRSNPNPQSSISLICAQTDAL